MIITKYNNGNTTVTLYDDGTKTIEYPDGEKPTYDFPNNIDCKITDYCNNIRCRPWCHEKSSLDGVHSDIDVLLNHLSVLPAGIEIAIGGGAATKHPELKSLLLKMREMGFVPNLTLNQFHIEQDLDVIKSALPYTYGVGISYTGLDLSSVKKIHNNNTVFHLIIGVHEPEILEYFEAHFPGAKSLLLGYKQIGNGIDYYQQNKSTVDHKIKRWFQQVPKLIERYKLSFDNLAIDQLNLKRLFTEEGWEKYYLGEDFSQSMYIDAVKGQYAPTSCSEQRLDWSECSILEFFKTRGRLT